MKKILKELRPFRVPLFILGGFGFLYVSLNFILPTIQNIQASSTPIVKIKASNDRVYQQGTVFKAVDFEVEAEHESGKYSTLGSDDFMFSPKEPVLHGKYTEVTITLKDDKSKKTKVKVKNERKEIMSIPCGKPNLDDVKAIIYSNGELAFEGKGEVLQYNTSEFPWKDNSDVDIKSVTFEEEIQPTSMDYWFAGLSSLEYIDPLPESVESIVGMCDGCIALEKAPEWDKSKNLRDATNAYKGCELLTDIPSLTDSIRTSAGMCEGCTSLQVAPDMSNAASLTNAEKMFYGCKSMTIAENLPPNVRNMNGMYQDCINLKKTPVIPGSVCTMSNTFSNNTSLKVPGVIPAKVTDVSGCYSNCPKLSGELRIDATPEMTSSFLSGSCTAIDLNLIGSSNNLNELALTNDSGNVYVNGKIPVKD